MTTRSKNPADHDRDAAFDRAMMQRACRLAWRGTGGVSPNPRVGCVIVDSAGTIIGTMPSTVRGTASTVATSRSRRSDASSAARASASTSSSEASAEAKRALGDREAVASTGIGQNVAIPHVKLKGLSQPVFSLALHPDGVDWNALDGEPVSIVFAVLRPDKPNAQYDPDRHRDMMSWIASLAREPDFRRFALQVKNRTELVDLVKEMSARLA